MDGLDTFRNPVVALIGHSASGKSACLKRIDARPDADMDVALGTNECPSLAEALTWLTHPSRSSVVAVSNHEEMLKSLHRAKLSGEYQQDFSTIRLVYLHKPKDRLKRHLARPMAGGSFRPEDAQRYTLQHYRRFHILFRELADDVIDCSKRSVQEVAARVRGIAAQVVSPPQP